MTAAPSPNISAAALPAWPAADTPEAEVLRLREIIEALTLENRLLALRLDAAEAVNRKRAAEACIG